MSCMFLHLSKVEIELPTVPYENVLTNSTVGTLYDKNASSLGVGICRDEHVIARASASTDMGNVSHVVPSIHPLYGIPTEGFNHTRPFTKASGRTQLEKEKLMH